MSLISKPVEWDVFNIPPIQPVQYYSILKKQREFTQLIKQYDAQVFRHGYLHYCGIVPKYLSSSLSSRCEIFIVFLDETPTTSFLGFRVKVSKETFTCESKSLLLFLRKSEKAVFYSMDNNCIHVQCRTNAWELFYMLYDDFLRRYVLTVIGTQFFYHFVYSYCIEKEKQFLKWICKGSKVIKISKSSIYYKIHRKRKISVTDLIHMTLNMPKRRKCTLSSFDVKESLLYSGVELGDFYTTAGNKVNISKLMLKKYKKQDMPQNCNEKLTLMDVTHKRKYDEIDASQNLKPDSSSKYFKASKFHSELHSVENHWKQYQNLKSFSLQNYSSISFINTLVPSLLNNETSFCNSDLHYSIDSPFLLSSEGKEVEMKHFTVLQKTEKNDVYENSESPVKKSSSYESKSECCVLPKDFPSHPSSFPSNQEVNSCTNNSNLRNCCDINSIHFSTNSKVNDSSVSEDANFTTAAGKVITISSAAMLKAYELCENEQILPDKITSDVKQKVHEKNTINVFKNEVHEENINADSKRKFVIKDIILPKISENKYSFIKNDEIMPKKLAAVHSSKLSSTESLNLDNFGVTEDVTFSTAAGKKITVSNVAMEAAHKLIYIASDEVKPPLHHEGLPIQRNQFYKGEVNNNGCTSKADVDMDNTLVENFFEDVQFEEKELQVTESNIKKDNLKVSFEPKIDKSLPTRKPKKSLGGRRSMKFYSDKL